MARGLAAERNLFVRVLGPVAIERDGVETLLSGKAAGAVALLVSRFPEAVPRELFFEFLWDENTTTDRSNGLRVLIHRIRGLLGSPDLLTFSGDAYRLTVLPAELDSVRFEGLVGKAGNQLADSLVTDACRSLDEALGLWRGRTAGTQVSSDFSAWDQGGWDLRSWQTHLETIRLDAEEDRIQALIDNDDAATAAVNARQLVDEQPYRERRWELLMLALYRSGRQREALDTASEATRRLQGDLGVEPQPSLRRLEQDILNHAPHLGLLASRTAGRPFLPSPAGGAMLGRGTEFDLAHSRSDDHQVVTIVGPGGIGKTTLALQLAHELARSGAEVRWCDLSGVRPQVGDRTEVAFQVGLAAGVRSGADRAADIAQVLSQRGQVAVVVDNCEHVIDEVRELVRGLSVAQNVTVLATSRLPLDLPGEAIVRLGPLDVEPACRLFERVADAVIGTGRDRDRDAVARICERLDCMPLAIELVARRTRSFTLDEIQRNLGSLLHDETGRPEHGSRHATMARALAWSVDLLSADGRVAAGSTAVFPGTFDLDAFEAVLGDRIETPALLGLEELLDHGLVQVVADAQPGRYRMLQPIRDHLLKHVSQEPAVDRDRHLDHYLALLEAAYETLGTTSSAPLSNLVSNELHNFGAVHEWALESGRIDDDMRLYRPLNVAHLYDRPEPFLWAQDTVQLQAAVESSRTDLFGDALHAAWYGALSLQLDIAGASKFARQVAGLVGAGAPHDLARVTQGLDALLVHHDYDRAEAAFAGISSEDPYVRYVVDSVGSTVRLLEANRHDLDRSSAIEAAAETLAQSVTWARSIGASDLVAGLVEQQGQVELAAGRTARARDLVAVAQQQAKLRGMGHVQAQAQFQLVRCDLAEGHAGPVVAGRLADALDLGVRSSAQARLRWQLPVASPLLITHGLRDCAALCLAASGFAHEARGVAGALTEAERAAAAERAAQLSLLDLASIAIAELRTLSTLS